MRPHPDRTDPAAPAPEPSKEQLQRENAHLRSECDRLEAALRKRDARNAFALKAARAGIWEWNLESGRNTWSDELWELYGLGFRCATPSYELWESTIWAEDREATCRAIKEATAEERDISLEYRVHRPNGAPRWLLSRAKAVRNSEGAVLSYLGAIFDITDKKTLEASLLEKTGELAALYGGLTDIVFIADIETRRIMECNTLAETATGRSTTALRKMRVEELHPPEERERILEEFALHARGELEVAEARLLAPDGRTIPVSVKSSRIGYQGRRCLMSVMRDISASKRQEAQFKENLQLKNDFISTISHELRTPLFSIQGFASTLLKGNETIENETRREFLEIIHTESTRLSILIEDILTISRIDAGTDRYRPERLDPAPLVRETLRLLQRSARESGIALSATIPEPAPPVAFDNGAFKQVLLNLLQNALKYTPKRGRVTIELQESGRQTIVRVADTGIGIAEEELEKIFERFYRSSRSAGSHEGTGLGLAIVRQLVELHGGTIEVTSTLAEGATFTLRLPQTPPPEASPPSELPPSAAPRTAQDATGF
ncbi:PAS domain-containing sensor histidine kinase [Chlorobium sp. N1]|uniref:PAS domain-containing sensor histidine kinase n=1 Tax=Chlorobium sp. N1 TaxID=2491138 RepID=UPI0010402AB7|nr:PAS domain-containing sensor histidine kinase [Chlorobium sp. N1]TCD47029.1 PAS domain S-box protein [Chlorobium sp. N1]